MPPPVQFWFEFASIYSYLSAVRLDEEARARGLAVEWTPFLLGPIFARQGWNTSPFKIYPEKWRYMVRDVERRAARYGRDLAPPAEDDPRDFPQHSVLAARMALAALERDEARGRAFCQAVFIAQFERGADIADKRALDAIASDCRLGDIAARAGAPEIKAKLRANTERAQALHLFGAPSFIVGEELFWGDDRLEDALDWACAQ